MRAVQDITFDVDSQTVSFDAPEGRPSSVTSASVFRWDVSDDDTAEAAIGTPAVETNPATTIDAASGAGQSDARILYVAATAGFEVGRTYLVTAADGYSEWFECAEIDSGNSVTAKHPLHNAYTTGDTAQSTRIQATVDATWVADESNMLGDEIGANPMYRVRWVYVVSGVTRVADTYFNLVRYPSAHGVRPQDVEVQAPGWLDMLPTDHRSDQGRNLIDLAYQKVRIDLHKIDLQAGNVAESEVIDEFVVLKTLELAAWSKLHAGAGDPQVAQLSTKRYTDALDSLVRLVSRVPVRDTSGAATAIVAVGLTRR